MQMCPLQDTHGETHKPAVVVTKPVAALLELFADPGNTNAGSTRKKRVVRNWIPKNRVRDGKHQETPGETSPEHFNNAFVVALQHC